MKRARLEPLLLAVHCPHCGEPVLNLATSSYDWQPTEVSKPQVIVCECGKRFQLGTRTA